MKSIACFEINRVCSRVYEHSLEIRVFSKSRIAELMEQVTRLAELQRCEIIAFA